MVLKTLFYIALLYLAFRIARNLIRAAWQDTDRLGAPPPPPSPARPAADAPRPRIAPEDIEDAQWEDL